MFGPHPFRKTHAWCNEELASRVDIGLQEVVEVVSAVIAPRNKEDVFVQIVKDFGMFIGDVAPHHHALAVRTQHAIDAVDVLVIGCCLAYRIHVCFGITMAEALGLIAVDVEIR